MSKTDVLVIGAGPAGSVSSAILNKAGLNVRVVEKEKFPRFVIGESLLPRCMEVLEDANLLDAIKAKNFQQKSGAKFYRDGTIFDLNFNDKFSKGWDWTWQVPRAEFDLALIEEVAKRGVPVDFETTVTDIQFNDDESSVTTVQHKDGKIEQIEAKFIVDASGYGRVIPRLFNLDKPSVMGERRAIFAHLKDVNRYIHNAGEPNRITIVSYAPGAWAWVIPFSNGNTSVGFVSDFKFFEQFKGDLKEQFIALAKNNGYTSPRFDDVEFVMEPRKLEAWSATTDKFYGKGYVLTGNVTEFLDPIFSSGVMFATVSSHIASKLVVKKFQGEKVDWDKDYTQVVQQGVDVFRSYVTHWYDGTLEKVFYAKESNPEIKRQIASVLAGYVWDRNNPCVDRHDTLLKTMARVVEIQEG